MLLKKISMSLKLETYTSQNTATAAVTHCFPTDAASMSHKSDYRKICTVQVTPPRRLVVKQPKARKYSVLEYPNYMSYVGKPI